MLSGTEMARLLKQFEEEYISDDDIEIPKNFSITSRVCQQKRPSRDKLSLSLKPSEEWAIRFWMTSRI